MARIFLAYSRHSLIGVIRVNLVPRNHNLVNRLYYWHTIIARYELLVFANARMDTK